MKILAKTFDKGQLQVILLPEEPKWHDLGPSPMGCDYEIRDEQRDDYEKALAYARAHPIAVREEDQGKILHKMYLLDGHPIEGKMWTPQDLTEYKLEMKLEIKEMCASDICDTDGACEHCREPKQVACLIEDDKPKESNLEKLKRIVSPIKSNWEAEARKRLEDDKQ